MSQESSKILQMLEAGQVTVDEATKLLNSLHTKPAPPAPPAPPSVSVSAPTRQDGFPFGEWVRRLASILVKQQVTEELDRQVNDPTIHSLEVKTTNGSIHYTSTDQAHFSLHARKIVRAPELADAEAFAQQVQLRCEVQDGVLQLYPDHPKPPSHVSVEVSFIIQGPRTRNITGRSTNGSVTVQGVEGVVLIQSTNGNVQADVINGRVEAKSTNGSVHATALTLLNESIFTSQNGSVTAEVVQGQPSIQANTVNGSVHLTLPADYAGQIEARTQNGQIRTDFTLQTKQWQRNWIVGQIGTGSTAQLDLRSQNGNITLGRRDAVPKAPMAS